jgi:hypothetical protein
MKTLAKTTNNPGNMYDYLAAPMRIITEEKQTMTEEKKMRVFLNL